MRGLKDRAVDTGLDSRRGVVVSVVSGKGGVGKTNLALNLGIQLAQRGKDVVLLDGDFGLANADILLNIATRGDFGDLLDPDVPVADALSSGPCGLRLLCGRDTHGARRRTYRTQEYLRAVDRLRESAEVLLIDCGAGLNEQVITFALNSDQIIVVTTPEPTALADSYATLKLIRRRGFRGRVGLVVNMARSRAEAAEVARRVIDAAAHFLGLSITDLGHVPTDRNVPQAVRARVPVMLHAPRCGASTSIEHISTRLYPPRKNGAGASVWTRVASIFL